MIIRQGYNNEETEIKIQNQMNGGTAIFIRESGKDNRESMSYMSANELLELYRELQKAAKDLFNVKEF